MTYFSKSFCCISPGMFASSMFSQREYCWLSVISTSISYILSRSESFSILSLHISFFKFALYNINSAVYFLRLEILFLVWTDE